MSAKHLDIPQAVTWARSHNDRFRSSAHAFSEQPAVMAEVTDNPGSGHYGDATNLLRALVDAQVSNAIFYAIYDAAAVQQGVQIGIGQFGTIELGGRHDVNAGGPPLSLYGKVVTLSDGYFPSYGPIIGGAWQTFGVSMLFRVGDNFDIAVISNDGQLLDISQITSLGCDPLHKQVIVVKSNHHFRASLEHLAQEVVTVDGGGLGSFILKGGDYKNVRRPIWPLDTIEH